MATIKDVAKKAGVSIATVSAVINGTRFVAEDTRTRVLAAVDALNYQPNRMARALKQKRSQMIAHILPSVMNPFFPASLKGVEDAAFAADYSVLVCNTETEPARIERYAELLLETQVDGVVITSPGLTAIHALAHRLDDHGIPVVVLSGPRSLDSFDRVLVDDVKSGYLAADHVLDYGHRRVAFVHVRHSTTSMHRMEGVVQALERCMPGKKPALVLEVDNFTEQEGYRIGMNLSKKDGLPTAVVAANDMLAVGISEALHDLGISVPEDVSLVGIDNTMAASLRPRLSSVAIPAYEMGKEAVARLKGRMNGVKAGEPLTITLNPQLVPGHSVTHPTVRTALPSGRGAPQ